MKKLIIQLLFLLPALVTLVSCSEESSETTEAENFVRIYDNNTFSVSYFPVEVVQTTDGGYIVLATRFAPELSMGGVYLLKTDKAGNFVKDLPLEDNLVNPLPGLSLSNGVYQFICMDETSQAKIISFDQNLDEVSLTDIGLTYPSASAFVDNEFLILSYDQIEKKTVFSRVAPSGNIVATRSFTISDNDSMEDEIIKHFLRTGTRFPFQVGKLPSGGYFFNGFYDYTFSLVFTNLSDDDDADGVVQGQQDHGGFSALTPVAGGKFAASYFHYSENYIIPNATLSTSSASSVADLTGFDMREFVPEAKIQIISATVDGRAVLIYATNTQSKQIGMFFYDGSSGEFLGSKYIGFTNPYEFGRVVPTSDGGLIIAGNTYIAGRFSRITLIKLSDEEAASIIR